MFTVLGVKRLMAWCKNQAKTKALTTLETTELQWQTLNATECHHWLA